MALAIKRIYEPPAAADGYRVLIDRLWPRGLSKADARLDQWCRELAPSAELRRWFGHDPARWPEFRQRYTAELDARPAALAALAERARAGPVTLLYAARDGRHCNAVVLRERLETMLDDG